MVRQWESVECPHPGDGVPAFGEQREVACEPRGVAADVHDDLGRRGDDPVDHSGACAGSRRVEDDDLRGRQRLDHVGDFAAVGSRQNTFSAVFPNSSNDEERYVDALLADYQGQITAHKIMPQPEAFLEDLHDFVRTQEEPIISSGPYAQYAVMREASKHVTVLLDGQGVIRAKGLTNTREHLESLLEADKTGFASLQQYIASRKKAA